MAGSHLVSQLSKLIENNYKEKAIIRYQMEQLTQQSKLIDEQIESFEKSLCYIDPTFDIRQLKNDYTKVKISIPAFDGSIHYLLSQIFKSNNQWRNLHSITSDALRLDKGLLSSVQSLVTRKHLSAVGNVIRKLYKKGIIERRDCHLHGNIKKRGLFQRSEWRLNPRASLID
ncbi:hypothetical protein L4F91_05630 [Avibacterium sp. 20-126]|uniref:hypothetical protein n=1 Tax=Avibacterium sp. 20-126 TaxID=2911524 RepID=UPI00218C82CC|nr:hypothetical protein L4F91_05630 [Avibacterium sp. 20-126]